MSPLYRNRPVVPAKPVAPYRTPSDFPPITGDPPESDTDSDEPRPVPTVDDELESARSQSPVPGPSTPSRYRISISVTQHGMRSVVEAEVETERDPEWKDPMNYTYPEISEVFTKPDADAKFTELLITAKGGKVTLLHRTFRNLDENETPEKRDECYYLIIRGIMKLASNPYYAKPDEVNELSNALLTDARLFPTETLTEVVSYGLKHMETAHDTNLEQRWVEIFTRMVGVLTTRDEIKFNDDVLDGNDLRAQVILAICRIPWGASNTASVISVIREIPGVTASEIAMIVDKVASSLEARMDSAAVPGVAYQLLQLAGDSRPASLIYHFDKFFEHVGCEKRLFEDESASIKRRKALGSTVYFFVQHARHSTALVKEMIKRIKLSTYDFQLVTSPFTLSVSLGLTDIDHVKQMVVDSLKTTVVKSYIESSYGVESDWYYKICNHRSDSLTATTCFKTIIDSKSTELDFMLDGLKELAMGLLNVEQLQEKHPLAARQSKELGIYLITAIVKRNKEYLPGIINELLKNQKLAYIECLGACLKNMVREVIKPTFVHRTTQLIQHLPRMSVDTASILIKALLPSLMLRHALLDEMLMILRKTIWKSAESRRISLSALVLMLANSTIIGEIPSSQHSQNTEAFFSQASQTQVDVFGSCRSNEPLCFEIISILKRFFSLQVEVKNYLYLELYTVIRKNPELTGVVCTQLLSHLKSYTEEEDLSLAKILDYSNIKDLKLKENLALFIQCICLITLRAQRVYRHCRQEVPPSVAACAEFLERFKNQLLLHGAEFYETEATKHSSGSTQGPLDFWDVRNARNTLINEVLGVLEAYIEFIGQDGKIGDGSSSIIELFKKFKQLKSIIEKPPPKQKGGTKKKTQNDNTVNDDNQQPGVSQSKGAPCTEPIPATDAKSKVKLDGHPAKKKFVYQYIMTLESVYELVNDMYGIKAMDLPTFETGDADFEKYMLCVIDQKIEKLKQKENINERKRKPKDMIRILGGIAHVLWKVCQKRVEKPPKRKNKYVPEEPRPTEGGDLRLVRMEILSNLIEYIFSNYVGSHMECLHVLHLGNTDFKVAPDRYERLLEEFTETWQNVFKRCVSIINAGEDKSLTGELQCLLNIMTTLCRLIDRAAYAFPMSIPYWIDNLIKHRPKDLVTSCPLVESVLKLYITIRRKYCEIPTKFQYLALEVHYVMEDINNEIVGFIGQTTWLLNKETGTHFICSFGHYVENALKLVNEVLGRLKAHSGFIDIEKLGKWRDGCCAFLDFLRKLLTELIRCDFSSTACGDILMKAVAQYFLTMSTLTGHMIEVHSKNKVEFISKDYENLVKVIGSTFKIRVEGLINHIEAIGKESCVKNKKGVVSASVKQKFMKDAKTVPDLIYNMEKYEQQVIALSKKTNINLLVGTKLSTARDFKIRTDQLPGDVTTERDTTADEERMPGPSRKRKRSVDDEVEDQAEAETRPQAADTTTTSKKRIPQAANTTTTSKKRIPQAANTTTTSKIPIRQATDTTTTPKRSIPQPKKKRLLKPVFSSTPIATPGPDTTARTLSATNLSPIGDKEDKEDYNTVDLNDYPSSG